MENKHKQFKPFDRVLVREGKKWPWRATFYSHYNSITYHHYTTSGAPINDILPYEGNEHLVGTADDPEEEVKLERGKCVFVCDWVSSLMEEWSLRKFDGCKNDKIYAFHTASCQLAGWKYAIRFADFNPDDMEETKKHILCVKNGKIMRYKG